MQFVKVKFQHIPTPLLMNRYILRKEITQIASKNWNSTAKQCVSFGNSIKHQWMGLWFHTCRISPWQPFADGQHSSQVPLGHAAREENLRSDWRCHGPHYQALGRTDCDEGKKNMSVNVARTVAICCHLEHSESKTCAATHFGVCCQHVGHTTRCSWPWHRLGRGKAPTEDPDCPVPMWSASLLNRLVSMVSMVSGGCLMELPFGYD